MCHVCVPYNIQGFLTDPAYLDFISFAQYATINQEMRRGKLVFVEQVCLSVCLLKGGPGMHAWPGFVFAVHVDGWSIDSVHTPANPAAIQSPHTNTFNKQINAEGDKQVVKRDPRLEDNALLPAEHSRRVGDRILAKFLEAPEIYRPAVGLNYGFAALLEGVRRVEELFVAQRFNGGATVTPLSSGKGFQVVSRAPANLWSLQNLLFRKEALLNDYEAKAILAYLRACGLEEGRVSYRIEPRPDRGEMAYTFTLS